MHFFKFLLFVKVICRTNIHRNNPEGSNWVEHHLLLVYDKHTNKSLPDFHQPFVIDIHVNQFGHTLALTDDNQIFYRVGVSSKCPFGRYNISLFAVISSLIALYVQ